VQAARCAGVAFHAKPVVGTMAIELKIAIVTEALRSLIMDFSSFVRGQWAGCPVLTTLAVEGVPKVAGTGCDGHHAFVYFLSLEWLSTRDSALMSGLRYDAAYLADRIAATDKF
jgi:hypothetical protein